jgi:hypothetical protein
MQESVGWLNPTGRARQTPLNEKDGYDGCVPHSCSFTVMPGFLPDPLMGWLSGHRVKRDPPMETECPTSSRSSMLL